MELSTHEVYEVHRIVIKNNAPLEISQTACFNLFIRVACLLAWAEIAAWSVISLFRVVVVSSIRPLKLVNMSFSNSLFCLFTSCNIDVVVVLIIRIIIVIIIWV